MSKIFGKSILAGLVGTVVMTGFMLMAPMMGMPEMNIGRMLGMFMGFPELAGWSAHFMIGSVLAVFYAALAQQKLPGNGPIRGMLFGLIPWLMAQVIVNPRMGAGVFAMNTPTPMSMVMGSLMGHLVYGAVVGAVYGTQGLMPVSASAAHFNKR
jgi:uncharacterized membrane protein YagU involved in acid resistance